MTTQDGPRPPQDVPKMPQVASNLAPKTRQDGARSRPGGVQIDEKWSLEATTLPKLIWTRFLMNLIVDLGGLPEDFRSIFGYFCDGFGSDF